MRPGYIILIPQRCPVHKMVTTLKYSSTNTYFVKENGSGLLVDTGYAGTLPLFFKALKTAGISIKDIDYCFATHYHPDHIGLIGELQELGIKLIIADVQLPFVHFADRIFARDGFKNYKAPDESAATVISIGQSPQLLASLGISGELVHTPSHSADCVSLALGSGECIVGDLEPLPYLKAYESNQALRADWDIILEFKPKRILYAHANEGHL